MTNSASLSSLSLGLDETRCAIPSYVFPKHQALNLNAIDNASSAMKKSTMHGMAGVLSFCKYNIFTGFGKSSSFAGLQLRSSLARHVKVFQPFFSKHAGGAQPNRILSARLFLNGLDAFAQLVC